MQLLLKISGPAVQGGRTCNVLFWGRKEADDGDVRSVMCFVFFDGNRDG